MLSRAEADVDSRDWWMIGAAYVIIITTSMLLEMVAHPAFLVLNRGERLDDKECS